MVLYPDLARENQKIMVGEIMLAAIPSLDAFVSLPTYSII